MAEGRITTAICALVFLLPAVHGWAQSSIDRFRINQVQVLGSHNSYKKAIDPALWQILSKRDAGRYSSLEYWHASFSEQLDLGLRKLEIDVVYDPKGGMYATPLGLSLEKGAPDIAPYDPDREML